MSFDPHRYMTKVDGKDYLPVAPRIMWFRDDHPDWAIITTELYADEESGIYRIEAQILNEEGRLISVGRGRETTADFRRGPYEKAETIAIGRALSALGYGTLDGLDYDDDGNTGKLADAPAAKPKPAPNPAPKADPDADKRRKLVAAIDADWNARAELDGAFAAWKRRKNSIIGQMKAAWPAIETADMKDEDAVRWWLANASLDDLMAYGKHNRKKLTAEREAVELANESEDSDES